MEGFAQKLKLARLGAGLSQESLAHAAGITKQMVSKYERGAAAPGSERLIVLAQAVGRKPGFLLRGPVFSVDEVSFRKSEQLPQRDVNKLKAEVAAQMEARLDLEHVLGIERSLDFGPLHELKITAPGKETEEAALALRAHWQLGTDPIANASEMLERRGIHVLAIEAPEGFEGMSAPVGEGHGVIVVRQSLPQDPFRFRFNLMHELAHLVLRMPEGLGVSVKERICNVFAGAMLFPAARVREEFGEGRKELFLQELIDQKSRYGISIAAQLYRLEAAGVIKTAAHRKIKTWLYETEDRKFERGMGSFPSEACGDYGEQLLRRALAEELITMSKAAEIKNVGLREIRELVRQSRGW